MVAKESNHVSGPWVIAANGCIDGAADYEKAISATGFGLFNILLLLASMPAGWTSIFDATSAAFILPATECDFELTLFRKGLMVSVVYLGIILSGILWDFVIRDCVTARFGKRTIILVALIVDATCNIASAFVKSFDVFLLLKFICGLMGGGPLTVLGAYLSEFHAKSYQKGFARWSSLAFGLAFIIPAGLAFNVLPYHSPFRFTFLKREFSTWQVYLLMCSIPPVLGFLTMCLVPESPKYLLSAGKTNEALELLRKIYRMNIGKPIDTYPIKALLPPQRLQLTSTKFDLQIREVGVKTRQLFARPYLMSFVITLLLQFGSTLGLHTMRLWVPQLFIILNNFQRDYRSLYPANISLTMCEMLLHRVGLEDESSNSSCTPSYIKAAVYVNSTIIASSTVGFGFLVTYLITSRTRKEITLLAALLISIASSFGANWAQEVPYMLTLCATIIVSSRIATTVVAEVNAEVIPIGLRSVATNYMTLTGSLASFLGNLIFSTLVSIQCLAAFMMIGCIMIVCVCLTICLPKPIPTDVPPNSDAVKF